MALKDNYSPCSRYTMTSYRSYEDHSRAASIRPKGVHLLCYQPAQNSRFSVASSGKRPLLGMPPSGRTRSASGDSKSDAASFKIAIFCAWSLQVLLACNYSKFVPYTANLSHIKTAQVSPPQVHSPICTAPLGSLNKHLWGYPIPNRSCCEHN